MRLLLISIGLLICATSTAAKKIVNVFGWTGYIPNKVLMQFEKATGITVHYSTYDDNATMYAKLKADPHIGYDVVMPSSYYVQRMRMTNMLHTINKSNISNLKYVRRALLNKAFDPHNKYTIPFVWGVTGIIVNTKYWNVKTIRHWSDLWQPRFKNQLLIIDDPREAFAISLIKLHNSINTQNPEEIKKAYLNLRKLMPNIKLFNADTQISIYADANATIGMAWNGDAFLALRENPNLKFVLPKDGFSMWIDCLAIPKYAPHIKNAEKFINFLLKPAIVKEIILAEGYNIANTGAFKLLPPNIRNNSVYNPSPNILKHAEIQLDVGNANEIYQKYWQLLKLGAS